MIRPLRLLRLRDRYVSRPRGAAWLLLADSLAAGAAIFLASGAAAAGIPLADRLLIAIWAILPCAFGRALDPILATPRGTLRNLAVGAAVGSSLVALVLIGLDLLGPSAAEGVPRSAGAWWMLLILLSWSAGFALFIPRTYSVHDLLVGGLAMLSLALGRPGGEFLAPVCLFGLPLSGAMRHQLHDVLAEVRRPRVNVHNARLLSLGLAAAGAVIFLGAHAGAGGILSRRAPLRMAPESGVPDRSGTPPSELVSASPGGESGELDAGAAAARAEEPGGASAADPGAGPGAGERSRIGYSRVVRLGNLAGRERDPRIVLTAREHDPRGRRSPLPSLPATVLWRGITLASFDAEREAWREEVLVAGRAPWPRGSLAFDEEGRGTAGGERELVLEITVLSPMLPTLPAPYFPRALSPPRGGGAGFRQNAAGDIFPEGGVPVGTTYAVRIALPPAGDAWPADAHGSPQWGAHSDPRYLEVPAPELLGLDLARHAAPIFAGASSIAEKIERLRAHFSRGFRYDVELRFARESSRLRQFLLVERAGNCEYFATAAALLLRAGGVSTRVVAGFLGAAWSAEAGEYRVQSGRAHLWTEVYFPGAGWFPLDATAWVESAESPGGHAGGSIPGTGDAAGAAEAAPETSEGELAAESREATADPASSAAGSSGQPGVLPPSTSPAEDSSTGLASGTGVSSGVALDGLATGDSESPWVELLPPPELTERRGSSAQRGRDRPAEPEPAERAARTEPRESRTSPAGASGASRTLLIAIALAVGALLVGGFFRPERDVEEEETEDLVRPPGGIPDPLEGIVEIPTGVIPSDPRGRVIGGYQRLQRDLAERRRHRRPPETPRDHAERIGERHPGASADFSALHAIVYAALYAPTEIGEREAEEAERAAQRLRERLG